MSCFPVLECRPVLVNRRKYLTIDEHHLDSQGRTVSSALHWISIQSIHLYKSLKETKKLKIFIYAFLKVSLVKRCCDFSSLLLHLLAKMNFATCPCKVTYQTDEMQPSPVLEMEDSGNIYSRKRRDC